MVTRCHEEHAGGTGPRGGGHLVGGHSRFASALLVTPAGTKGIITRTTSGTRFAPVKAPARKNLNGVTCVTASACYAAGAAGTIEALRPG